MFHFTRGQRRRWSLPMVAILLLHWCLGFGEALADVICLEPNGQAVIERAGEPCDDAEKAKQSIKHCIDLALDDGHANHELVPGTEFKPLMVYSDFSLIAIVITLLPLSDPLLVHSWTADPPTNNRPVTLRKTTVLHI